MSTRTTTPSDEALCKALFKRGDKGAKAMTIVLDAGARSMDDCARYGNPPRIMRGLIEKGLMLRAPGNSQLYILTEKGCALAKGVPGPLEDALLRIDAVCRSTDRARSVLLDEIHQIVMQLQIDGLLPTPKVA